MGLIVDNNYNLLTGETYNREQQDIIFANEISGLTGLSHQQNTDFQLLNNGHIVSLDAGGTLHIENISQVGSGYTTHSEQVYTTKNEIILRDGAVSGLAPGEFAGIRAKLYDGVNDGVLEFDSSGVARVGDVGSTQAIATMEDNPVNNGFAYWDGATFKFNTKVLTSNDVSGLTTSLGGYLTISGATNTYATINSLTGETFNRINQDNILQTNINNKFDLTGGTINGNLNIYSGYTISGNGSGLNNIPASGITGLQLDRISSGSNSAIMSSSGLTINTGMTVGGNLKVNSTSGTTLFQVTEASSNYLMEITDVDGNDIITVSENEGDTLLDVIETGGSTVFSVGNDGSIKQNSVTRTGVTSTLSPYGVINISKFSCSSVFFDYVIKETGSNAYRCGTVMCVQDGTNVSYTETSKTDLNASTSGLTFSTQIVGSFIVLVATITSGTWNIYVGARKL